MVASAPETVIEAETVITTGPTVVTETPRRGFGAWLRDLGRSIGSGVRRFFNWVGRTATNLWNGAGDVASRTWVRAKSAGRWLKDLTFRAGRGVAQGARWVWDTILWSGRTVGHGAGNVMRFFAHGARRLALGTPRFLLGSIGWTMRLVSLLFRTAIEFVFSWVFVFWLIIGVLVALLAWGHREYDDKLHRRTVALSKNDRNATTRPLVDAKGTMGEFVHAADERIGHWADQPVPTITDMPPAAPPTPPTGPEAAASGKMVVKEIANATGFWNVNMFPQRTDWKIQSVEIPSGWDIGISHLTKVEEVEAFHNDMLLRFEKYVHPDDPFAFLNKGTDFDTMRAGWSYWKGRSEAAKAWSGMGAGLVLDSQGPGKVWAALHKSMTDRGAFDRETVHVWRHTAAMVKLGFDHEMERCRRAEAFKAQSIQDGTLSPEFSFLNFPSTPMEPPKAPVKKAATKKAPSRRT